VANHDLVDLPGGDFAMGSSRFYPEEGPVHQEHVAPFAIDRHPVTNAQFAAFVEATGYVTVAERALDPSDFPGADPELLVPGGLVFTGTAGPVDLADWTQWWTWGAGAQWRHPTGPGSAVDDRPDHPVVQVCVEDATAYATWAGLSLPAEAEWELAARGGLDGATYSWGDDPRPDGRLMANTWQGRFPWSNTGAAGWRGTSPVGTFPANGYGLLDMTGNVWEWTTDYYASRHVVGSCCAPARAASAEASAEPGSAVPRQVIKGGSHLCAPEYCLRYRPAARSPQAVDTATSHIGFRCVSRPG
jgi:sulfatase modifying factor 1